MMRLYCRSCGAALPAAMMALCVLASEAWAGCNPPGGPPEINSFTVSVSGGGPSVTVGSKFNDNPTNLYVCGDTVTVDIDYVGSNKKYVGWVVERDSSQGDSCEDYPDNLYKP